MPGKQTYSPASPHTQMYAHTNAYTKSKRAVGQSARVQLGPVSADLVDEALHVEKEWGGREWQVKGGEGNGTWGRQKHSSNDGTWAGEPAHTRPDDPSAPVYSSSVVTSPSCHPAPGCLSGLSFLLHHLLSPRLWILPETSSERDVPLHRYHAVSLTHLSQMPLTHPFWCLPSTCEWATVTGKRERQRETEREEGRGRKKGALERAVYFARLTENSPKCWVGITLSNIDCDFLGEKQPALVNLEWLWNNLDPPPHIVECQRRNALQQFIATYKPSEMTGQSQNFCSLKCHPSYPYSPSLSHWITSLVFPLRVQACATTSSVLSDGLSEINRQALEKIKRPNAQFHLQKLTCFLCT